MLDLNLLQFAVNENAAWMKLWIVYCAHKYTVWIEWNCVVFRVSYPVHSVSCIHDLQVPIFRQRAGRGIDGAVVWDYHVIAVQKSRACSAIVWDLDSTMAFGCPFDKYAQDALRLCDPHITLPPFPRMYRVIHGPQFLKYFASDRSHMMIGSCVSEAQSRNGLAKRTPEYQSPPPVYPCIVAENGATNTLPRYLDMLSEICSQDVLKVVTDLEDLPKYDYGCVLCDSDWRRLCMVWIMCTISDYWSLRLLNHHNLKLKLISQLVDAMRTTNIRDIKYYLQGLDRSLNFSFRPPADCCNRRSVV